MKKFFCAAAAFLGIAGFLSAAVQQETGARLTTNSAKLSYALGMEIGTVLKGFQTEIDLSAFARGVDDTYKGVTPQLTEKEATAVKQSFFTLLRKRKEQERTALAAKNKSEAETFLAKNKKRRGVITTADGLQYVVIRKGSGPKPAATDKVRVNYKGTLLNGTVFDSSYARGRPAVFPVDGVIKGWQEALKLMPVGSKYKLFIPPNLAYGAFGAGPKIPPESVLIFEVELLGIEK